MLEIEQKFSDLQSKYNNNWIKLDHLKKSKLEDIIKNNGEDLEKVFERYNISKERKQSYSSLSLFAQCPYKYYLKYALENYIQVDSIPLKVGNLCHKVKELQLKPNSNYNKEDLIKVLYEGYIETEDKNIEEEDRLSIKNGERVQGLKEIEDIHWEDYYNKGSKSGLTYKQKIENFIKSLEDKEEKWIIKEVEKPFSFERKGISIVGKIDKIEENKGKIRITDYKTSDKSYREEDLKTPLQMFIYNYAYETLYGILPEENIYDFILINEKQNALSKGYYNRGLKKLDSLIDEINYSYDNNIFKPKPSPLCAFCEFSKNSYNKDKEVEHMCEYYSLWTRENKTFAVNKKFIDTSNFSW